MTVACIGRMLLLLYDEMLSFFHNNKNNNSRENVLFLIDCIVSLFSIETVQFYALRYISIMK